jgi:hypothetical protein
MSVARAIARRLFGRSIEVLDLEIAFHKEANHYGTHGVIIASHKDHGLKNQPVRFVFIGMTEPPAMTPRIIEYVWEEARAQGFVPSAIQAYGHVLHTHSGLPARALISTAQRQLEDERSNRNSNALETTLQAIAGAAASEESVPSIDSLLVKAG